MQDVIERSPKKKITNSISILSIWYNKLYTSMSGLHYQTRLAKASIKTNLSSHGLTFKQGTSLASWDGSQPKEHSKGHKWSSITSNLLAIIKWDLKQCLAVFSFRIFWSAAVPKFGCKKRIVWFQFIVFDHNISAIIKHQLHHQIDWENPWSWH